MKPRGLKLSRDLRRYTSNLHNIIYYGLTYVSYKDEFKRSSTFKYYIIYKEVNFIREIKKICYENLERQCLQENGIKIQRYSISKPLNGFLCLRTNSEGGKYRKQLGLNHGVNAILHIEV